MENEKLIGRTISHNKILEKIGEARLLNCKAENE